ncbi:hypothetical protein ACJX0J_038754, partial [Zea mays]
MQSEALTLVCYKDKVNNTIAINRDPAGKCSSMRELTDIIRDLDQLHSGTLCLCFLSYSAFLGIYSKILRTAHASTTDEEGENKKKGKLQDRKREIKKKNLGLSEHSNRLRNISTNILTGTLNLSLERSHAPASHSLNPYLSCFSLYQFLILILIGLAFSTSERNYYGIGYYNLRMKLYNAKSNIIFIQLEWIFGASFDQVFGYKLNCMIVVTYYFIKYFLLYTLLNLMIF